MAQVLILNGALSQSHSKGRLNASFADRAKAWFEARGDTVRLLKVSDGYDVEAEVTAHLNADIIVFQFPVNTMGVPWVLKKYMDEVYTAGMDGRMSNGDGRSSKAPKANYGMGGLLHGTRYMISATLNAPAEAFDNPDEPFFQGRSLDDVLGMVHLNGKFIGMSPLPSFAAFDVHKNPTIEADFARFDAHLAHVFSEIPHEPA